MENYIIGAEDTNVTLTSGTSHKLSPAKLHIGHEVMHGEMLLILLVVMFLAQIILLEWKRRYNKSYMMATLFALWIIPPAIAVTNKFWRFFSTWVCFSLVTFYIMIKSAQKPISGTTPRWVYKWFLLIYKLSYFLGIISYTIIMCTFFGLNAVFGVPAHSWMDMGMILLFYGLYYGVIGQDLAEICADKMACHIGFYTPEGMPTRHLDRNMCAVCGNRIMVPIGEEGVIENTYKLSCHHTFHEFCIRGWCIVGKKQVCPYCKEKVDLKRLFPSPWEKPHVLYGNLLHWVRWLLSWQPIIMMIIQLINYVLGLE